MMTGSLLGISLQHPPVRRIVVDEPGRWMGSAWRDFRSAPGVSLAYGSLFVLIGYVIVLGLHNIGLGSLVPVAIAGFFLVAPILAVGLYEVSRRLEQGERATFEDTVFAFRRNLGGLSAMGLVLMLAMAAWTEVALLIFMMFFHASPPPLDDFIHGLLMSPDLAPFLAVGMITGYVIASIVFAVTAISIPMLLDRDVSASQAMAASVAAVRENWRVMLGWAATIVILIGIGFATMFVGLAFTIPLTAYATWHAYRSLVE